MLHASLSLALLGLGAVQALPTKTVEERSPQTWTFGPPSTSLTPGDPHRSGPPSPWQSGPVFIPGPVGGDIDTGNSGSQRKCDRTDIWCRLHLGDHDSANWSGPSTSSSAGSSSTSEDEDEEGENWSGPSTSSSAGSSSTSEDEEGENWPRRRDGPHLPPDRNQDRKDRIARLETELEALQNKRHKSDSDWDEIDRLRERIERLAGVIDISAPSGSSSTFTPGKAKRQEFSLPTDGSQEFKDFVAGLEQKLERLQNKQYKSAADRDAISELKDILRHVAGVVKAGAPAGGSVTFTPGR